MSNITPDLKLLFDLIGTPIKSYVAKFGYFHGIVDNHLIFTLHPYPVLKENNLTIIQLTSTISRWSKFSINLNMPTNSEMARLLISYPEQVFNTPYITTETVEQIINNKSKIKRYRVFPVSRILLW